MFLVMHEASGKPMGEPSTAPSFKIEALATNAEASQASTLLHPVGRLWPDRLPNP